VLILALETATDKGSLALLDGEAPLLEYSLESAGTFLSRLPPALAEAFAAAGRAPSEIGAIGVSVGPGNFTGLRIGCAIAKTMAWSLGCPLVPVPTMEVLAAQLPFQAQAVGVVLDAKRSEVFWGLYSCPEEWPREMAAPVRLSLAELNRHLSPPLILTGYVETLAPVLPAGVVLAPMQARRPRATTVARLALSKLKAGLSVATQQLAPTYLRPAL
jgi:tRNA threonylcarbamoyladenosine biosynthesis protein TsaB